MIAAMTVTKKLPKATTTMAQVRCLRPSTFFQRRMGASTSEKGRTKLQVLKTWKTNNLEGSRDFEGSEDLEGPEDFEGSKDLEGSEDFKGSEDLEDLGSSEVLAQRRWL